MKRWITADWHLGEDRFQIMQRPGFADAGEMVDHLMDIHNDLVAPEDEVWIVGDVVNQNTPEWLDAVSEFNGRKILFRGNHDRVFTDEQLAPHFVRVIPEGEGLFVTVGGIKCFVTHYPTQGLTHAFNLVGHIHSAWKVQINALNVGVDVHHYRPIDLDKDVPFFYKAITEFYDDDVWVAYHSTQQTHSNRGKPGRYLDVDGAVGGA